MTLPLISFVTVLHHNVELPLGLTDFFRWQSLKNWEWIIVSDYNQEATCHLYRAVKDDTRINFIYAPVTDSKTPLANAGYRFATANFLVLSSDIFLLPDSVTLEKWLWILYTRPGIVIAMDENKKAFLIRKSIFDKLGGLNDRLDFEVATIDLLQRCTKAGMSSIVVPAHANGITIPTSAADLKPNEAILTDIPNNFLEKTKRRVLFLFPWLVMGGADKFNLRMIHALTEHGWEVSIATTVPTNHTWYEEFARLIPDIFILDHFLRLPDYPRFLHYLIVSRDIDVVCISNSQLAYYLLPYLRSRCPDKVFIDYNHMEEEYWENGGHPGTSAIFSECLDRHLVSSFHLRDWMVARGVEDNRIAVVYTNEDCERWCPDDTIRNQVRMEFGIPPNMPVILYSARICPQKKPLVLAETLLKLHKCGHHFTALIAGNGPDFDILSGFITNHGLKDCVHLLGIVSNDRINMLMKASDIFFLPSDWEGIALSIYEAMASGLAVLGTDVGGQRELVHAGCGILVPKGDDQSETNHYVEVLDQWLGDLSLIIQMRQNARKLVNEHFRLDQMGERLNNLLTETTNWKNTQPRPSIGSGLGRACASRAIEYARISHFAESLWHQENLSMKNTRPEFMPVAHGILRLLLKLEKTRFGKWLLYNRLVQKTGQLILEKS